ncbi:3238_t:CDS:2, partial [Racocetra persica]
VQHADEVRVQPADPVDAERMQTISMTMTRAGLQVADKWIPPQANLNVHVAVLVFAAAAVARPTPSQEKRLAAPEQEKRNAHKRAPQ